MSNTCIVSVIIPTYNAGKKILYTLESVYQQDYEYIELIICDDGSKDNTLELVEGYLSTKRSRFKEIIILRNSINVGTVKNIYRGYRRATGLFIKPLAQGDLFFSISTIRRLVNRAIETRCDIVFGTQQAFSVKNGLITEENYTAPEPFFCKEYEDSKKAEKNILGLAKFISGALLFFKTNLIQQDLFRIPASVVYCEDFVQVLFVIEKKTISYLPENIIWYEYGEGISTEIPFRENKKMIKDHISFYSWLLKRKKLNWKQIRWIKHRLLKLKTRNRLARELISIVFPDVFYQRLKNLINKKQRVKYNHIKQFEMRNMETSMIDVAQLIKNKMKD